MTALTRITGDCVKANTQLVTLVALNITTDAMLILLPMPWLIRVRKSWWKYVSPSPSTTYPAKRKVIE